MTVDRPEQYFLVRKLAVIHRRQLIHRITAMRDTDLFDATIHNGIAMGSCVMIRGSEIVYAGAAL